MKSRKNHFILTATSALFLAPAAFAANTWDGGGAPDGNWSNALNWGGAPPDYGTALTFAGTANLVTNNNSATASVVGLTFSSGADAFTLNGSSVTLGGNITNSSTSLQTVNLPLVLNANRTIATTSGNVTLGGPISGAFTLIKTQGNTLTMNAAGSSFSLFQVNTGTARLGVNDALPTTAGVTFATGVTAILNLNGKTQTLGGAVTVGGTAAAGTVTISDTAGGGLLKLGGNVVQNASASPTVNISAALDLNGATRTFTVGNPSGIITVSGSISDSTGTAGLTKSGAGPGELILSGANTYNGDTRVTTGLLTLSDPLALQNSTLDTTNSIVSSSATTGLKTTVSTLTLGGLSGNKNLAALFDATNGYSGVTALTLNPGTGADLTHTGVIADGAVGMTLTKTGAGKQTLNAVNLYTGSTILNGGTLNYSNASALSSGPISYTGGTILQAGVAAILSNAISVDFGGVGTVGTNGFDTTLSGPITGAGTLAKGGTLGVLTLTGGEANTIAGGIRVAAGRLVVPDGKSLTNTGPVTVLSGGSLNYSKNFAIGNDLTNAITLSGPGDGTIGALNLQGNATATGAITLAADATISHDFNTATISNSITGTDLNLTLSTLTTGSPQPGMTVSGPISLGTGGVTVTGVANSGGFSIKLSGDNIYSGGTLVTSGILLVSNTTGSGTGSAAVSVNAGAAIGGSGTIAGTLNLPGGATLVPGNFNIGTLTVGDDTVIAGTYRCGIDGISKDMLAVTGDLDVTGGTLEVVQLGAGADQASYIIASCTGTLTGTLVLPVPVSGYNLVHDTTNKQIRLDAVGGGDSYATWATANGIPGQPFDEDFNLDGISNGVAYALGLSPTLSSQPAGALVGTTITFTKGADAITNEDVTWIIESSLTLSGSWMPEVTQDPGDDTETISYNLNPVPGTPKKFARLKVVKTP